MLELILKSELVQGALLLFVALFLALLAQLMRTGIAKLRDVENTLNLKIASDRENGANRDRQRAMIHNDLKEIQRGQHVEQNSGLRGDEIL